MVSHNGPQPHIDGQVDVATTVICFIIVMFMLFIIAAQGKDHDLTSYPPTYRQIETKNK